MDDYTAISRLKNGDLAGLEALVERYQVKALHTAQLILRDRQLADEIVQAAFVRCAERIHQFDDNRPFAPWFLRIIINEALKAAERQERFIPLVEESDGDASRLAGWLVDPQPQPEKLLEIQEANEIVHSALARLVPEQRAVVVMRYYLEMSETDMSASLDRPISTIKWWLREARRRLRELLRPSRDLEDGK